LKKLLLHLSSIFVASFEASGVGVVAGQNGRRLGTVGLESAGARCGQGHVEGRRGEVYLRCLGTCECSGRFVVDP